MLLKPSFLKTFPRCAPTCTPEKPRGTSSQGPTPARAPAKLSEPEGVPEAREQEPPAPQRSFSSETAGAPKQPEEICKAPEEKASKPRIPRPARAVFRNEGERQTLAGQTADCLSPAGPPHGGREGDTAANVTSTGNHTAQYEEQQQVFFPVTERREQRANIIKAPTESNGRGGDVCGGQALGEPGPE